MSALSDLILAELALQDYWPFDGAGTPDANTQGTSGVFHGSPSYDATAAVGGSGSVSFPNPSDSAGTGDYFTSGDEYAVGSTGGIELWVKPPSSTLGISTPGGLHLLAGFVGGDGDVADTQIGPVIFARYNSGAGAWQVVCHMPISVEGEVDESSKLATANLTADTWNHVVFTWRPGLASIYINGSAQGTLDPVDWFADDDAFSVSSFNEAGFNVGGGFHGGGASSTVFGMLASFAQVVTYYGGEPSSDDVLDHYNAGFSGGGGGGTPDGSRVTQLCLEILRSAASADYSGSGLRVSTLSVEILCSSRASSHYSVSASSLVLVSTSSPGNIDKLITASTSFIITPSCDGFFVGSKLVSGVSSIVMTDLADYLHVGAKFLDALSSFIVSQDALSVGLPQVNAISRITLVAHTTGRLPTLPVSAISSISMTGDNAGMIFIGGRFVSAVTSITVSLTAGLSSLNVYRLSAVSAFSLSVGQSYRMNHTYVVSALERLRISSAQRSRVDRVVSASSSFSVTPAARQVRNIVVAAATSIGVSMTQTARGPITASATDSFVVHCSAGSAVTGLGCTSRIAITDRASAVLWFPWRRRHLGVRPSGNIPHS